MMTESASQRNEQGDSTSATTDDNRVVVAYPRSRAIFGRKPQDPLRRQSDLFVVDSRHADRHI